MTYIVEFTADNLRVTGVAVSAGHCPLERPEQSVVDLQERGQGRCPRRPPLDRLLLIQRRQFLYQLSEV